MSFIRRTPPPIDGLTSLKVGNISYSTRVIDLRRAFNQFGPIGDVYIPIDKRTGNCRGFGFVRFYKKSYAEAALKAMDGRMLYGRELRVQMTRYDRPTLPIRSPSSRRFRSNSRSHSRSRSRSRYHPRSRSRSSTYRISRRSRSRSMSSRMSRSRSRSSFHLRKSSKSRNDSRFNSKSYRSRSPVHAGKGYRYSKCSSRFLSSPVRHSPRSRNHSRCSSKSHQSHSPVIRREPQPRNRSQCCLMSHHSHSPVQRKSPRSRNHSRCHSKYHHSPLPRKTSRTRNGSQCCSRSHHVRRSRSRSHLCSLCNNISPQSQCHPRCLSLPRYASRSRSISRTPIRLKKECSNSQSISPVDNRKNNRQYRYHSRVSTRQSRSISTCRLLKNSPGTRDRSRSRSFSSPRCLYKNGRRSRADDRDRSRNCNCSRCKGLQHHRSRSMSSRQNHNASFCKVCSRSRSISDTMSLPKTV